MVNNEGTKIIKEDLLVGVIVFGGFIDQVYLDEDLQLWQLLLEQMKVQLLATTKASSSWTIGKHQIKQ